MVNISFWGSPGISARLLQSLIDDTEINIRFVVTQEDKPRSQRGRETEPTPVKALATKHQIPVFTPKSLKKNSQELLDSFQKLPVEANVVFAYGKLIPESFIELPSLGTLNFHASLLPELRGASPIEHALIQGLKQTGWTMQKMVKELDAGDVYYSENIPIGWTDDFQILADKMMARLIFFGSSVIKKYVAGKLIAHPQDHSMVTHCGKIDSAFGQIQWNHSALGIRNLARALSMRGGIYTFSGDKKVKLFPDFEVTEDLLYQPETSINGEGVVARISENHIWINCGENSILPIQHAQPDGKKRMPAKDFVNGYRIRIGQKFG